MEGVREGGREPVRTWLIVSIRAPLGTRQGGGDRAAPVGLVTSLDNGLVVLSNDLVAKVGELAGKR